MPKRSSSDSSCDDIRPVRNETSIPTLVKVNISGVFWTFSEALTPIDLTALDSVVDQDAKTYFEVHPDYSYNLHARKVTKKGTSIKELKKILEGEGRRSVDGSDSEKKHKRHHKSRKDRC